MKTTTQTIARINAWQAGYVMAACYLFAFLLFAPVVLLIAFNIESNAGGTLIGNYAWAGTYSVIAGFFFTAFGAGLYNAVTKFTGGLKVEIIKPFDHEAYATSGYSNAKEQAENAP
jgi:hypothetical protein